MKVFAVVCLLAAVLASPALGSKRSLAQAPAEQSREVEALNYALVLEYLQAEFYSCAAFGNGISDELRGGGPASIGCQKGNYVEAQAYAEELANTEIAHVRFIRQTLGDQAAPIPQLDVGPAFAQAGNIAFENSSVTFSPYDSDLDFFLGAFLFEDVGVTAYEGALAFFLSGSEYVGPAAQIVAVESYQAGLVRTILFQSQDNVTTAGVDVLDAVADLGRLRQTVGAGAGQGLVGAGGDESNLAASDADSLAFLRVPGQIVQLLTLSATSPSGGFIPEGLSITLPGDDS